MCNLIISNGNTYYQSNGISKLIIGEIVFKVNDFFFPIENWEDCIVVIIGWWIKDILSLLQNHKKIAELRFMKGGYKIEVNFINNDLFTLDFIEEYYNSLDSVKKINYEKRSFLNELLAISSNIIRICELKRWNSKDLSILKENNFKLENLYNSLL